MPRAAVLQRALLSFGRVQMIRMACVFLSMVVPAASGCRGPAARPAVIAAFSGAGKVSFVDSGGTHHKVEPNYKLVKLRRSYDAERDPTRRTRLRNQIMSPIVLAIKNYHEGTEDDLFETVGTLSVLFDWLGIAVNTTGVFVGGESAKTLTNAIAGALIGVRSSLEKEFLANNTKTALLLAIDAERMSKEASIRNNMKATDAQYSLDQALPELFDFYTAGSLRSAVTGLVKAAQNNASKASAELQKVTSSTTHDDKLRDATNN